MELQGERQLGKVIAFYSFKGGTGRSMALANVACLLAARATRPVLVIDWDLEAPGIHRYFRRELVKAFKGSEDAQRSHPGLIDLFVELRDGLQTYSAQEPASVQVATKLLQDVAISDFVVQTDRSNLHMLKAGAFDDAYASKVSGFDWQDLYARAPGMLRALSERLAEDYEWVLIDSRTGLTDTSGICTMLMPETLVVVFTPNRQSVEGVVDLIRQAARHRSSSDDLRPLMVYPLPSRVEASEPALRKLWRHGGKRAEVAGFQEAFERAFTDIYQLDRCDLTAYFDEVQIQHVARYAYGEEIAVLAEESRDRLSLTRSFERFLSRLVAETLPWEDHLTADDEDPAPAVDQATALPRMAVAMRNEVEQRLREIGTRVNRLTLVDILLRSFTVATFTGLVILLALQAEKYALWLPLGLAVTGLTLIGLRELLKFQQQIALSTEIMRELRSIVVDLERSPNDPASHSVLRSKLSAILDHSPSGSLSTRDRPKAAGVYISYRRSDSAGYAGRLFDSLRDRLGDDRVTMDIDSIGLGEDFVEVLTRQLDSASIVLVLIGPDWLASRDQTGRSRLHDPTDFVRVELMIALTKGHRVIPVLVGGARMPNASELPDSLKDLVYRNGLELSPRRWDSDVQLLVSVIESMSEKVAA